MSGILCQSCRRDGLCGTAIIAQATTTGKCQDYMSRGIEGAEKSPLCETIPPEPPADQGNASGEPTRMFDRLQPLPNLCESCRHQYDCGEAGSKNKCDNYSPKPITGEEALKIQKELLEAALEKEESANSVPEHNSHYVTGEGPDVIEFIRQQRGDTAAFEFCIGSAMKYLTRCGKKKTEDPVKELEKVLTFTRRAKEIHQNK